MKQFWLVLCGIVIMSLSFTTAHKYFVSITQIEYKPETKNLQIITRVFIDDFERLLKKRYDDSIVLDSENEPEIIDTYISKYLKNKIEITINGALKTFNFIGKEYDSDLVYCYLEINNVETIKSFEIKNSVFFDLFPEQKNVIRMDINNTEKSFILIPENNKGVLNFN